MSELLLTGSEIRPVLYNPFKGPSAYSESDKEAFYGRDSEKREIIRIIKQNTLSLLYSRSGNGKSSLIKAGIFPILKELNDYFPVYVRLSMEMIDTCGDFSTAIIKLIKDSAQPNGVVVVSKSLSEKPTLTEFIYQSRFSCGTVADRTMIPVLIFDQFEELFSAGFDGALCNDLIRDLGDLIESRIPESLSHRLKGKIIGKEDQLLLLKDNLQSGDKWYRVLFSFREEYLTSFQTLKEEIPSVFYTNACVQLQAFPIETARKVIISVSKESKEIGEDIAGHLANILAKTDKTDNAFNKEVSPFFLSLVCKNLYTKIMSPADNPDVLRAIGQEDDSLISLEIEKYSAEVFGKISRKTRTFIEEELITEDGKRTMHAFENIYNEKLKKELVELTGDSDLRYLTFVEYFGSKHIEILHDRLLRPLIKLRSHRRRAERNKKISMILLGSLVVLTFITAWLVVEKAKNEKYDAFITKENHIQLEQARQQVVTDPSGAIRTVLNYNSRIRELPLFTSWKISGGKSIGLFHDSIRDIFRNVPLFYHRPMTPAYSSYSGSFRYTITSHSTSSAGNDTLKLERLDSTGNYTPAGKILLPFPAAALRSGAGDERRINNIGSLWICRFSYDDSKLCTCFNGDFFIYNLLSPTVNGFIRRDSLFHVKSLGLIDFIFSLDSRFLLINSYPGRVLYNSNSFYLVNSFNYVYHKDSYYYFDLTTRKLQSSNTKKGAFLWQGFAGQDGGFVPINYLESEEKVFSPGDAHHFDWFFFDQSHVFFQDTNMISILYRKIGRRVTMKTLMKDISYAHILSKTNRLLAIGRFGEVELYDLKDGHLAGRRASLSKNSSREDSAGLYMNSFVSPREDEVVINYTRGLEMIDLVGFKGLTYKRYPDYLLNARFSTDRKISLISRNGNLTDWYYKVQFKNYEDVEDFDAFLKSHYPEYTLPGN